MYRVVAMVSDSSACTYYRTVLPVIHCVDHVSDVIQLTPCETIDRLPGSPEDYDCFIFSRLPMFRFTLGMIVTLRERGKRVVWDLDDDLVNIPDWSPVKKNFPKAAINELRICLKLSDIVTVSTAHLAERVAEDFAVPREKIVVLENLIDMRFYQKLRNPSPPGHRPGPLRVIWTGSSSHTGDIEPFKEIYKSKSNDPNTIFYTYGHFIEGMETEPIDRLVHLRWGDKKFYEPTLTSISPSISLIPLSYHRFNKSKSAIKYYESTAAGAVCLASKIPPYSDVIMDGVTGYLVDPAEGWEAAYGRLASNKWAISQVWKNALGWVTANYSWNTDNPRRQAWIDFYRSLAGQSAGIIGVSTSTSERPASVNE